MSTVPEIVELYRLLDKGVMTPKTWRPGTGLLMLALLPPGANYRVGVLRLFKNRFYFTGGKKLAEFGADLLEWHNAQVREFEVVDAGAIQPVMTREAIARLVKDGARPLVAFLDTLGEKAAAAAADGG